MENRARKVKFEYVSPITVIVIGLVQRPMDNLKSYRDDHWNILIKIDHVIRSTSQESSNRSDMRPSLEEQGSGGCIDSVQANHESVESEFGKPRSASTLRSRKLVRFLGSRDHQN